MLCTDATHFTATDKLWHSIIIHKQLQTFSLTTVIKMSQRNIVGLWFRSWINNRNKPYNKKRKCLFFSQNFFWWIWLSLFCYFIATIIQNPAIVFCQAGSSRVPAHTIAFLISAFSLHLCYFWTYFNIALVEIIFHCKSTSNKTPDKNL